MKCFSAFSIFFVLMILVLIGAELLFPCVAILFAAAPKEKCDVAAFVWPAFQPEPRWAELGIFQDGKGEWQNIYEAVPRFKGHDQPRVPLWGYENEADPKVMEKKIDAAQKYGVNVFIYDWYWFEGRPFLEEGLNSGFLGARNNSKMKFYIMWANHNVDSTWNNKIADKRSKGIIWKGAVSFNEFKKIADRVVKQYFIKKNYYKIDGKPVFSIYELSNFIDGVGGIENAKEALLYLDNRCKEANLGGVHVQTMCWNLPKNLATAALGGNASTSNDVLKFLDVASMTTYNWIHYLGANNLDYKDWGAAGVNKWNEFSTVYPDSDYFAHVSIGWDNNAHFPKDKTVAIVRNTTPQQFEVFLRQAKAWTVKHHRAGRRLITINAWNEWPEGSYLEPDKTNGYGYLEAVKKVFIDEN